MKIQSIYILIATIVTVPFIAFGAGPFGKKPPAPPISLPENIFGVTKPRGSTPQSPVGSPAEQMRKTAPAQTYAAPSSKRVVTPVEAPEAAARLKEIKKLERRLGEDALSKEAIEPSILEKKADMLLHNEGYYDDINYQTQPYYATVKDGKMMVVDAATGKPLTRKEIMAKLNDVHGLDQFSEAEANRWQGELMKEYDSYANQYKKDFERLQQLKREQSVAELVRQRDALQGNIDFINREIKALEGASR